MSITVNIDDMINKAVKEAIKQFNKERIQEESRKVFHNTRLLLLHYNDLNEHVKNAIDSANKIKTNCMELDNLNKDEIYILSLKRSKIKTLIMLAHIDMSMEVLKQKQIKLCALEKYEALEMFYLGKLSYDEIIKHFNCGVNTPRRWINDISTVELNPSKTRGKRKPKSIFAMKSKIVNGITNNNEQYKKINDIIRKDIIGRKKNVNFLDDKKLKKLFIEIHSKLPGDRRQWNYNYNTLNNVRPLIDKMTDIYIEKYTRNDLLRLKAELKKQETNLKEAYGPGENSYYKKYYDTKLKDLKTRMGNTILNEIKEYDYSSKQQKYKGGLSRSGRKSLIKNSLVAIRIKRIEKIIGNSYQHFKNQKAYGKLQNEIERDE